MDGSIVTVGMPLIFDGLPWLQPDQRQAARLHPHRATTGSRRSGFCDREDAVSALDARVPAGAAPGRGHRRQSGRPAGLTARPLLRSAILISLRVRQPGWGVMRQSH